jgi:hypothetical protein
LDRIQDDISRYIMERTKTEKKHVTRVREEEEEEGAHDVEAQSDEGEETLCW